MVSSDIESERQSAMINSTQDVYTTLEYYKQEDGRKTPRPIYVGKQTSYDSYSSIAAPYLIKDMSQNTEDITLDEHGFCIINHSSKVGDFSDQARLIHEYYPETSQLLKDVTGASRVFIFNHTIRGQPGGVRNRLPYVRRVHIDQAYTAAENRVRYHLMEEADELLQSRYQCINIWRPIRTVYKDPLAVADARSIPDCDCVRIELIQPESTGYTLTPIPKPGHSWYYCYAQRPDQVLLFKTYDSEEDGRARRVPHASFVDPSAVNSYTRESIELRALIFHSDDK